MLTREAVVKSETTFAIEKVLTPAWAQICGVPAADCYLYVRTLGADRWPDIERTCKAQQEAKGNMQAPEHFAQWAVLGACDEHGEPFFTEADVPALVKRPVMALVDIANATMRLNGVTTDEPAKKEGAASSDAPKAG